MTSESLKAIINSRVRTEVLFVPPQSRSHPALIQDTSCVHLCSYIYPEREVLKLLSILTQVTYWGCPDRSGQFDAGQETDNFILHQFHYIKEQIQSLMK